MIREGILRSQESDEQNVATEKRAYEGTDW
jgi:hypothetical protein